MRSRALGVDVKIKLDRILSEKEKAELRRAIAAIQELRTFMIVFTTSGDQQIITITAEGHPSSLLRNSAVAAKITRIVEAI